MSDSSNNNSGGKGWEAGFGGLIGAALGESGFLGGNKPAGGDAPASMDQVQASFNALRGENQVAGLGAQIAGVKDAIAVSAGANQLAHCGLGHSITAGFASVNQNILAQTNELKSLALQQALDAERARATELRIELSEHKNASGHAQTQVLVQQLVNAGKA